LPLTTLCTRSGFWFNGEMFICAIYQVQGNRTVVEYFSKVITYEIESDVFVKCAYALVKLIFTSYHTRNVMKNYYTVIACYVKSSLNGIR